MQDEKTTKTMQLETSLHKETCNHSQEVPHCTKTRLRQIAQAFFTSSL